MKKVLLIFSAMIMSSYIFPMQTPYYPEHIPYDLYVKDISGQASKILVKDQKFDLMVQVVRWANKTQKEKNNELAKRVNERDFSFIKILIVAGADINAKDILPRILHYAVYDVAVVSFLLDCGASLVNEEDAEGYTALHWAAYVGNVPVLKLLLEKGACVDINKQNKFGNTPLHDAVLRGHKDVVQLLLENGAKESLKKFSIWGYTPLSQLDHCKKELTLLDLEILQLLRKYKEQE